MLKHTDLSAYLRSLQMSTTSVFVFVEGPTDRNFYDKICESVFAGSGIDYEIRLAQELPTNTGGKAALLNFFDFLSRSASLIDDFKGKVTRTVFFVDRDIDGLLREFKQSNHVIYTEYYQMENYFFAHGNLVEAVAAAALLDRPSIRAVLDVGNDAWRRRAAANWREWVYLCVLTRMRRLNHACNYGVRTSSVHGGPYGPLDQVLYAAQLAEVERRSRLTPVGFKRVFGRISREIDGLYNTEHYDLIFKGKWYVEFLIEDIGRIAAGRQYNAQALPARLLSCLQMSLNFDGQWADYFKNNLRKLI